MDTCIISPNSRKRKSRGEARKATLELLAQLKEKGNQTDEGKPRKVPKGSNRGCMKGKGGPENAACTFRGVRQKLGEKWVAEIRAPKKQRVWLGTFKTSKEAALAYDEAAKTIFGSSAILNFPDGFSEPTPSARPSSPTYPDECSKLIMSSTIPSSTSSVTDIDQLENKDVNSFLMNDDATECYLSIEDLDYILSGTDEGATEGESFSFDQSPYTATVSQFPGETTSYGSFYQPEAAEGVEQQVELACPIVSCGDYNVGQVTQYAGDGGLGFEFGRPVMANGNVEEATFGVHEQRRDFCYEPTSVYNHPASMIEAQIEAPGSNSYDICRSVETPSVAASEQANSDLTCGQNLEDPREHITFDQEQSSAFVLHEQRRDFCEPMSVYTHPVSMIESHIEAPGNNSYDICRPVETLVAAASEQAKSDICRPVETPVAAASEQAKSDIRRPVETPVAAASELANYDQTCGQNLDDLWGPFINYWFDPKHASDLEEFFELSDRELFEKTSGKTPMGVY